MVGAVAVGMFHRADLGIILAAAHYISSIIVGIMLRFYKGNDSSNERIKKNRVGKKTNIFTKAVDDLIEARRKDGRGLGELIGDSIKESISTLLLVGGFIILFSVITRMFIVTGLINTIGKILIIVLQPLGLTESMVLPLVSGFFEITNGSNLASQAQAPLIHQIIIVNAIIAWSGLSVHAQVATMVNGTDIKLKPYIFARIAQSILAGAITIFLFRPYNTQATFLPIINNFSTQNGFLMICIIFLTILSISMAFSMILYLLQKIKFVFFYYH